MDIYENTLLIVGMVIGFAKKNYFSSEFLLQVLMILRHSHCDKKKSKYLFGRMG
jgi:hypothetical protein